MVSLSYLVPLALAVALCHGGGVRRPNTKCYSDVDCMEARTECQDGMCHCQGERAYYATMPAGCYSSEERKKIVQAIQLIDMNAQLGACNQDDHCRHVLGSICLRGMCRCPSPRQFFLTPRLGCFDPRERLILLSTRKPEEDADHVVLGNQPPVTLCAHDSDCSVFASSICLNGECRCTPDTRYVVRHGLVGCMGADVVRRHKRDTADAIERQARGPVIREISRVGNELCMTDDDCPLENSRCDPSTRLCVCEYGYHGEDGEGVCVPIVLGSKCDPEAENFCSTGVPGSICCVRDGFCICPSGTVLTPNLDGNGNSCQNARIARLYSQPGVKEMYEQMRLGQLDLHRSPRPEH